MIEAAFQFVELRATEWLRCSTDSGQQSFHRFFGKRAGSRSPRRLNRSPQNYCKVSFCWWILRYRNHDRH